MKKLFLFLICLSSLTLYSQETKAPAFNGHTWIAPYHLPKPQGWGIERFLMPASFAPQITYKGVEDIRFTPGWSNAQSPEYWTYAFLWYLDEMPDIDADKIADNLKAYYTGLIEINRESYKVPAEKVIPVVTSFKSVKKNKGDLKTFTGTVTMLDYMQQKPVTLNCIVHIRSCPEGNKTIMFYELSPQSFSHSNWKLLDQLWEGFDCKEGML